MMAKVKHLPIRVVARGSKQESVHHVRHKIEIAALFSTPENPNRFLFDQSADPNAEKCLSRIFHAHSGSVRVRQSQRARANSVHVAVK